MTRTHETLWTFAITSVALFMVSLDNLVVSTAIPVIRTDLDASLEELDVDRQRLHADVRGAPADRRGARRPLRPAADVRDRARRSSPLGSVAAALAPSVEVLNIARAVQGLGGAIVMPLTLTILSAAVPAERRGLALGAWGGIGGLAIALGPLVGGAVVEGVSWQWIFWLNVPIGLVLVPLALRRLQESHGPVTRLDLPGLGLVSAGLFGIVWGLIRGNGQGWTSPEILGVARRRRGPRRRLRRAGSCAPRSRCCRCGSSATAPSRSRTSPRCSCSSGCSARSSCSPSSSRPCRATRRSTPGCGSSRGRSRRCSSRPSPVRCPTGSTRG